MCRALPLRLTAGAAMMLGVLAACGNGTGSSASEAGDGFAGICAALTAARAGDIAGARSAFDHGPLHDLAGAASDVDRAAAARLLESKQRVESLMEEADPSPREVVVELQNLADAAAGAQVAAGDEEVVDCSGAAS